MKFELLTPNSCQFPEYIRMNSNIYESIGLFFFEYIRMNSNIYESIGLFFFSNIYE